MHEAGVFADDPASCRGDSFAAELLAVLLLVVLPPEVRLAGARTGFAQRGLNRLGGGFTTFALEAIGLDGDLAGGGNADMNAAAHNAPPSNVSRIEPSASIRRVLRSPRKRASRMVLWTP